MSVQSATTRNDYTAGASQTVYAYTFEIKAASDITVIVGGVTKSLNTDYTVSGVGTNSGGNVTLSAAPASGTTVSLVMEMDLARDTDYQANGAFLADDVNNDFDSLWLATNQQETELGRSLRLNQTEPTSDMTLPLKDARKGSVLAFNETTGLPVAGPTIANVDSVAGITGDIATVADNDANITTVAGISGDVTSVANISANVTTVAGNTTNINAVAADASDIGTVASNISNVNTTAGISSDVTTVAGNNVNITTVAGDSSEITTVAGVASDVSIVSGIASDVTAVAGDASDIGTVASSISNVNAVGTNITNVNNVAGNASNINTVAADGTDIGTVAGISANVTTVAGISSDVTTVAGLETKMDTVIADASDIGTVAGISANVTTVANNSSNVTTVAGLETKMDTIIADAADIGAVATNINSVTTVSGISGDVTTVASKASDVETVADNIGDVQAASQNATNAAASAQAAASSASTAGTHATNASASANQAANSATGADDSEAAAGISASAASSSASAASSSASSAASSASDANDSQAAAALSASGASVSASAAAVSAGNSETAAATWNNFYTTYLGAAASAPSTDLLGQPLQDGALYFNTTDDTMYVFNGSIWIAAESTINIVSVPTQLAADLTTNGNDIIFDDNDKATFGAGSDLQIFHSGTNSHVKDAGTGSLLLQGDSLYLSNAAGNLTYFYGASSTGAAQLRYGNSPKLTTTSTGIDVTGNVVADGLTVDGTATFNTDTLKISDNIPKLVFEDTDTSTLASITANSSHITYDTVATSRDHIFKQGGTTRMVIDDTGIDVTGSVVADGLTVDGTGYAYLGNTAAYRGELNYDSSGNTSLTIANSWDNDNSEINFKVKTAGTGKKALQIKGSGDISFYEDTGTTPKLFWDASAESLGIGTTSPDGDLDVRGAGLADLIVRATSANSTSRLLMRNDAQSFALRINGDDKFRIKDETADADRLVVDTSGNVGIGTSSPSAKLHVQSGGKAIQVNNVNEDTYMTFGGDRAMFGYGSIGPADMAVVQGASGKGVAFCINNSTFGAGEAMRIDSSGRVGIGTDSPSEKLHVTGASTTKIQISSTSSTGISGVHFGDPDDVNSGRVQYEHSTDHMGIYTNNAERMRIDTSGNVIVNNGGSGNGILKINGATGNTEAVIFQRGGTEASRIGHASSADLTFSTGSAVTERMRIDASGNLLVGKSATGLSTDGAELAQGGTAGKVQITRTSNAALLLNRRSTDGTIADFRKDGTTVGSIGNSGVNLMIGKSDTGLGFSSSADAVFPIDTSTGSNRSSAIDLGASTARFKDLYLSGQAYASYLRPTAGSTDFINFSSGAIRLATGGSESARIDTSGNLLVGKTSDSINTVGGQLNADGLLVATRDGGNTAVFNRKTSDGAVVQFRKDGTTVGSISVTASATAYNTSSDQRLKENIADADDAGSKIDAIQVRKYDWKADGSHQDYGMIAQELQAVAPEAVSGDADSEEMMGVDYSKLVPMLIKEIQSLRNRVAQLEE